MGALASVLVVASIVTVSAVLWTLLRPTGDSASVDAFLRLCLAACVSGLAACVMWLMSITSPSPVLPVFADLAMTATAALFVVALAARRSRGVTWSSLVAVAAITAVGVMSLTTVRAEALTAKSSVMAVLCVSGLVLLRRQPAPRWFIGVVGAVLSAYAVFIAARGALFLLGGGPDAVTDGVFGILATTIVSSAAFGAVSVAILLLRPRERAGCRSVARRGGTVVVLDDVPALTAAFDAATTREMIACVREVVRSLDPAAIDVDRGAASEHVLDPDRVRAKVEIAWGPTRVWPGTLAFPADASARPGRRGSSDDR